MEQFNRNNLANKKLSDFQEKKPLRTITPAEYIEEDEDENIGIFSKIKVFIPLIFIAIICFISYAWYTDKFAISQNKNDIPIIKADTSPLREKPEDPGGMKIINRDKRVYETISGKNNENESTKSANILPAPEEPLSRQKIVGQPNSEMINHENPVTGTEKEESKNTQQNSDNSNTNIIQPTEKPQEAQKQAEPAPAQTKPEKQNNTETPPTKTSTRKTQETENKKVTASDITDVITKKKKEEKPKKNQNAKSGYKIQLGSFRNEGDANISWKNLKKKIPDLLKNFSEYIEKVDLGEKGIFYRLQVTGFKSESEARKLCQVLNEKKQGCFFVGK